MNSKVKGKRFELELAARLREAGYEARRTAQYAGNTGEAADVVGLPGIHIEAKHQETMRLYEWMEQAVRDTTNEDLPAVFHRKNREGILVTMRFDDWMQLYRGAEGNGFPIAMGMYAEALNGLKEFFEAHHAEYLLEAHRAEDK